MSVSCYNRQGGSPCAVGAERSGGQDALLQRESPCVGVAAGCSGLDGGQDDAL